MCFTFFNKNWWTYYCYRFLVGISFWLFEPTLIKCRCFREQPPILTLLSTILQLIHTLYRHYLFVQGLDCNAPPLFFTCTVSPSLRYSTFAILPTFHPSSFLKPYSFSKRSIRLRYMTLLKPYNHIDLVRPNFLCPLTQSIPWIRGCPILCMQFHT